MPFYQETKTAKGAVIGTILPWTGGLTSIPAGWIICDGQTLSASDFPLLAQAVGDTYNAGSSDFDGNFLSIDNRNGEVLWNVFLGSEYNSIYTTARPLVVKDKVVVIKLNETKDLIKPLCKKSNVHDDNVTNLLNYYELVNELKTIHG